MRRKPPARSRSVFTRSHAIGRHHAGTSLHVQMLEDRLALTSLPAGFTETLVTTASDLSGPTAMEFSPTGDLWVLEQSGQAKLVRTDGTTFTALTLNTNSVDSNGERGLLGIAFDPNFVTNHFVYVYYTNKNPGGASWADHEHNQLSRFTVNESNPLQPVFTNEAPILDWNNLVAATNHNGGAIHFGADGMLYADAGDNTQTFTRPEGTFRVSQTLDNLLGKQLRIDVSKFNSGVASRDDETVGHLIPADNPFVGTATGVNQLIYVLGLRNPYTFAVQPGTGRIFINDVGESTWEEIDDSIAGANYGWSGGSTDGFGNPPPAFAPGVYHDPVMAYDHSDPAQSPPGVAITGGVFYPSGSQFGSAYAGKYFFADLSANFIRVFDPANPGSPLNPSTGANPDTSTAFASNLTNSTPVDLKVDSLGNLYYLSRGGDTGEIFRISMTTTVAGEKLFYNQSAFDGNAVGVSTSDDLAIATDKTAYHAGGGSASSSALSTFSRGINGVMVDLLGAGSHASISANDFVFKVGNDNTPSGWATVPAPSAISVRAGAGVSGSDRVEIIWGANAVKEGWLEVEVLATANTGLAATDVLFWGSLVGDANLNFATNSGDGTQVLSNITGTAAITNTYDVNRSKAVNSGDGTVVLSNTATLTRINLSVGAMAPVGDASSPIGPVAIEGSVANDAGLAVDGENGVVSTVAAVPPMGSLLSTRLPAWAPDQTRRVERNGGSVAVYFQQLADENRPRARIGNSTDHRFEDASDIDDELLDSLLEDVASAAARGR